MGDPRTSCLEIMASKALLLPKMDADRKFYWDGVVFVKAMLKGHRQKVKGHEQGTLF